MLTKEQMQTINRHRRELILLGMVLAKTGDRDFILNRIRMEDFTSDIAWHCIVGVMKKDPAIVRESLERWGIDMSHPTVCDSLLASVRESANKERARRILFDALHSEGNDLGEVLESALQELNSGE